MTSCQVVKLSSCQVVKLSSFQVVKLSSEKTVGFNEHTIISSKKTFEIFSRQNFIGRSFSEKTNEIDEK